MSGRADSMGLWDFRTIRARRFVVVRFRGFKGVLSLSLPHPLQLCWVSACEGSGKRHLKYFGSCSRAPLGWHEQKATRQQSVIV
jgi:hypothetical protein